MKVFWSYAKRDDAKPYHVSQLREQFQVILEQCVGDDIDLFQDKTGLKWGDEWRAKLESEVKRSSAFVCVLSPSFFKSKMCVQELVWALNVNESVSIYPILYRACPKGLKSSFSEESDSHVESLNERSARITEYQYVDFTKVRNEPKDSVAVRKFLDEICEQIAT